MSHKTDWFRDAKWGVFMHYHSGEPELACKDAKEWNKLINNFDVQRLAQQLIEIEAGYFFITLGQNSGFYLSPNSTYNEIVERKPSHCSQRDIVAELIEALAPSGVALMVYLPSHAPANDLLAAEKLKCTPGWDASKWQLKPGTYVVQPDVDKKLSEFQRNWEAIIREWSLRWGSGVKGWWFDGCYHSDTMYRDKTEPNFKSFAAATQAGNPKSIAAFNSGIKLPVVSTTKYEDYTAGEVTNHLPVSSDVSWERPIERFVDGAQYHILTYLGSSWGKDDIRFVDELVIGYTKNINSRDGVITWDIGVKKDGLIAPNTFRQLKALKKATRL